MKGLLEAFLGYRYLCVKDECSVRCICIMWVHCVYSCVCICMMCVYACVCVHVSCCGYGCQKIILGFISDSTFLDTAFHNSPYIMSNWSLSFCDPPPFPSLPVSTRNADECHHFQPCDSSFNHWAIFPRSISIIHLLNILLDCLQCLEHCSWMYLVLNKLHAH